MKQLGIHKLTTYGLDNYKHIDSINECCKSKNMAKQLLSNNKKMLSNQYKKSVIVQDGNVGRL